MTETLTEKAKRRRAELAAEGDPMIKAAVVVPPPVFDPALIPDVGPTDRRPRSQQEQDIDRLLEGITIDDAYRRWCGKMEPVPGRKRESVMVSCPTPEHRDSDPSAWLNLDDDVWFCGGCQVGGDKYDIAAWGLGFDVPGYKTNGTFPDLRHQMAESMGYQVTRTLSGATVVTPLAPVLRILPPPVAAPVNIAPQSDEPPELDVAVDWHAIVPKETFMWRWMQVTCVDDLPDEYYFWLGLMAVGFASGDDVVLDDNPLVKPNFNLCLYGPSGIGKSRSMRALAEVLDSALPYEANDPYSTGICHVSQPGSAEALLDSFSKPEYDPTNPKIIVGYHQVRGWLRIDELSDLMGKAARQGNVLKPLLMRLYDGYDSIDHRSRGHGVVKAERPFCSAVTTTQPRAIRDLLVQTDADSGFVNRWIFGVGQPKKQVAIGRGKLDIQSTVPMLSKMRTWSSGKRTIVLDAEAKAAWEAFFEEIIEPIKLSNDSSLLTRCDLTLKKIMLLFAINEGKTTIDVGLVERTLTLWPYLRDTYEMLAGEIGIGEFEDCRVAVLDFIVAWEAEMGTGPAGRDISRRLARRFSRKLVADVLANLCSLGEIVSSREGDASKGSRSERYSRVA